MRPAEIVVSPHRHRVVPPNFCAADVFGAGQLASWKADRLLPPGKRARKFLRRFALPQYGSAISKISCPISRQDLSDIGA